MPGTLVVFHAHPDDEAITTGGTMARAAAEGHRVVLVLATRGELGEVADGVLAPGESLAERRVVEAEQAAAILGVAHVDYLGYHRLGHGGRAARTTRPARSGPPTSTRPRAASPTILRREQAEVLTVYDERGGYGHPDHVQVHRVGVRAAELAGTPRVYESTMDRDHVRELIRAAPRRARTPPTLPDDMPDPDDFDVGVESDRITTSST